ncbi:MAG: DUF935 domain-containing protein [Rhodocyclaceae bacterium]|nr:DUF935 domain-containing protein [Rhodocyclaceae bacterium]
MGPLLLDQFGRPFDRAHGAQLAQPQTAAVAHLHQQYAEHPAAGITPARLHQILCDAETGAWTAQLDLFEDMEDRDGHMLAEMLKRRRALMRCEWKFEPPAQPTPDEERDAEWIEQWLRSYAGRQQLFFDLTDAIGKGFAPVEIAWRYRDGEILPEATTLQPQRWFVPDRATRREIRLYDHASPDGAPLRPFTWLLHRHAAKSGYPARAALYRVLAWPYVFRWYSARDLAEFLEIYGLPVRIGKYPSGANPDEKATLLRALVGIGHNAAGIIPDGMQIDFEAAAEGQHDGFAWMIDWCERTASKAILGQTLSAEARGTGLGSGTADLQAEVRDDIRDSDAEQLAPTITRDLAYPILALNGRCRGGIARCPQFRWDLGDAADMALFAEALPKLAPVMPIPAAWAYRSLRIPAPKNGEAVLQAPAAVAPMPAPLPGSAGAGVAPVAQHQAALRTGLPAATPDLLDELIDQARAQFRPLIEPAVATLLDSVWRSAAAGAPLTALRDELAGLLRTMPIDQLAEQLARAGFTARLLGEAGVDPDGAGQ